MAEAVPLPTLLSHLLVAFTIEFDNEFEKRMPHWTTNAGRRTGPKGAPWLVSQVMFVNVMEYLDGEVPVADLHARARTERDSLKGLARWNYTLRVLDETGVPIRELPKLTGVSKEGNTMALGFLAGRDCVVLEPDPSARRGRRTRLTSKGKMSQVRYHRLLAETEEQWNQRFGADKISNLRLSLQRLPSSLLFEGSTPYPNGWRASVVPPETLPHFPMVLHRGGYPDGS
jgi:DNA-binding MarR family transcriptional regulator